uniref:RNA-directed DNA polymerase from mobile element jockey n=1 Tax=Rhipicephalus appendiculatus TaxID=34631 RepID=A0A131YG22_RHIAP
MEDDGTLPQTRPSKLKPLDQLSITEAGILNLLLKLDSRKSSGPDDISNAFLRRYAEWMATYLLIIFNKSLSSGTLPGDWKTAKVKPIHKLCTFCLMFILYTVYFDLFSLFFTSVYFLLQFSLLYASSITFYFSVL